MFMSNFRGGQDLQDTIDGILLGIPRGIYDMSIINNRGDMMVPCVKPVSTFVGVPQDSLLRTLHLISLLI